MQYAGVIIAGCLPGNRCRRPADSLPCGIILLPGRQVDHRTHHPEQKYWPLLCEATGQTELLDDPRFGISPGRGGQAVLVERFDKVFATRREASGSPVTGQGTHVRPVQQMEDVLTDAQALSNGMSWTLITVLSARSRFPGTGSIQRFLRRNAHLCARAGEHTDSIMREIGYSDQEIAEARQAGVIR